MKIALVSLCTINGGLNPIGILYLASWIKAFRPQHQIDILEITKCDLSSAVREGGYDFVGISAMTLEYETATRLAKELEPLQIPIVVGGVHITLMPESLRSCFTLGVVGEGEETLCELLDAYENRSSFKCISGIVFTESGKLCRTVERKPIDLHKYPRLCWDMLPSSYWTRRPLGLFGEFGIEAEIITTRGCPFRCSFCASTQFFGRVRTFSPQWVVRELVALQRFGVTHVQVVDDLFTVNKRHLREMVETIRANAIHRHMTFALNSKASVIDDEICTLLLQMNAPIVGFGFESGNDRVLKMLKSDSSSVQANKDAITLCVKYGLAPLGGIIFGSPTETIEEMNDSIRFIEWAWKAGANRIFVFVLIPYPSTPMWDIAKKRGTVIDEMNFNELDLFAENGAIQNPLLLDQSIPKAAFRKVMERAVAAVHPFKWRKAWMFLRNNPISTIVYALRAPWALVKRTFSRKAL